MFILMPTNGGGRLGYWLYLASECVVTPTITVGKYIFKILWFIWGFGLLHNTYLFWFLVEMNYCSYELRVSLCFSVWFSFITWLVRNWDWRLWADDRWSCLFLILWRGRWVSWCMKRFYGLQVDTVLKLQSIFIFSCFCTSLILFGLIVMHSERCQHYVIIVGCWLPLQITYLASQQDFLIENKSRE